MGFEEMGSRPVGGSAGWLGSGLFDLKSGVRENLEGGLTSSLHRGPHRLRFSE
jgi:hypothetical protein